MISDNESLLKLFGITPVERNSSLQPYPIYDTELYNTISEALGISGGSVLLKSNQSPEKFVKDKNGLILSLIRDEKGRFSHCDGFQLLSHANIIESPIEIFNNQVLKVTIQHYMQSYNTMIHYFDMISNQIFDLFENDKKDELISIKEFIDQIINEIESIVKSNERRKAYIDKLADISERLRKLSLYFIRRMVDIASTPINHNFVIGIPLFPNSKALTDKLLDYRYICQVVIECFETCSCLEFILGKEVTNEAEDIVIKRIHSFKFRFDDAISTICNILKSKQIEIPIYDNWNYYANMWANDEKWKLNGFADSLYYFDVSEQRIKETFDFARQLLGDTYIEIKPSPELLQ